MPESISSKTNVRWPAPPFPPLCRTRFDTAASMVVLSASITRESSPPDAISSTGPSGSPGFAEIRYCTASKPFGVQFPSSSAHLNLEARLHRQFVDLALHLLLQLAGGFVAMPRQVARRFQILLGRFCQLDPQLAQDLVLVFHFAQLALKFIA